MNYPYDLHIHSCLSPCADNEMTPENIAGMAYINQLEIIALTDHNSCKNCEALLAAAKKYDVFAICGMELSTAEDIHVLCYFPDLDHAMAFDAFVETHLIAGPNRIDYYGNQLLYAPGDRLIGEYEPLLPPATDIPFRDVADHVEAFGGVHVPAHLERPSHSMSIILGGVPKYSRFTMFEVNDYKKVPEVMAKNPSLQNLRHIQDSDAHTLEDVKLLGTPLVIPERSFKAVFGL